MANEKTVFISYSSKDIEAVNKLTRMMDNAEISYWKAPEMIPVGSNYAKEIPRVICECEVFLIVISENSQKSIWVEKEIDYAINNRKTIVPIKITSGNLSDIFRFYLNNVQMIHCVENWDYGMQMLKEKLKGIMYDYNEQQKESEDVKLAEKLQEKKPVMKKESIIPVKNQPKSFAMNPQPSQCCECGGDLIRVSMGKYKCIKCGAINYDYFQRVRNYLNNVGTASILIIEKDTGIPRASIEYFLQTEMLEIPKNCDIRLVCEGCGAPIRTGRLCERCKEKGIRLKSEDSPERYTKLKKKRESVNYGKKYLGTQ